MKKRKKVLSAALVVCLLAALIPTSGARAYTPPYSVVKVGLYHGSSLLPYANLQNVSTVGLGKGFEFGYYDSNRNFVPTDATVPNTSVSIMKDWNMYYDGNSGGYLAGTGGSVVVGCYHIQLNSPYSTYNEARAVADNYSSAFVKFTTSGYYVCVGQYTTSADAANAIATNSMSGCSVTSGSANTITVVAAGTNNILFEFDGGSSTYLAVRPTANSAAAAQTWLKGVDRNKDALYYGDFQFTRPGGGDLAVISIVGIEQYTKCVVPHESPSTWPIEALKVQALCARTYVMANLNRHSGFDMCATDHCQVYGSVGWTKDNTNRAVDETAGLYITYNGKLCQTYFSSSDGGATENSENVWKDAIPYLRGVIDPYEASIPASAFGYNYSWTITFTQAELTQRMRDRGGKNCSTIVSMRVSKYSPTGNVIEVILKDSNGQEMPITKRDNLNYILGVPSIRFNVGGSSAPGQTNIYVNDGTLDGGLGSKYVIGGDGAIGALPAGTVYAINGEGDAVVVGGESTSGGSADGMVNGVFTINGTGRGHNVGVSQWGTYAMAYYHNKTFLEIINFYYTGVTIG